MNNPHEISPFARVTRLPGHSKAAESLRATPPYYRRRASLLPAEVKDRRTMTPAAAKGQRVLLEWYAAAPRLAKSRKTTSTKMDNGT